MAIADSLLTSIAFNEDGLVPCIAQCHKTGRVLMMAWMNRESVEQTMLKGEAVYWSRSRQRLWHKGEQSGHIQKIHGIQIDCDGDTLLIRVEQIGDIACHTGTNSCFFREYDSSSEDWRTIETPIKSSKDIYSS